MNYTNMTKDQLLGKLRKMEQRLSALEASEKQYRGTLESLGDAISIQDTDYKILYQNQAHKKLVGDHKGMYCYSAYRQSEHVCDNCHLAMAFRDGKVHTEEQQAMTEDGPIWVEITASPLKDADGRIVAGIEAVRNITERRKSEEALRLAEAKFRSLVEQALVGIYIIQGNRFPYVNPRAAEIFGYTPEEIISGITVDDLIHEEDRVLARENIRKRIQNEVNTVHYTLRGKKKDGTVIDLEVQGTRTEFDGKPAVIGSILDITERRKMEAERSRIQNLESLGVFASGVAHEYNNLLTAIIGNLSLAKMYAKPGYEVYDVLTEAEKASVRAKDLTSQLLLFAEGSRSGRKVIDLKESLKKWVNAVLENSPVRSDFSFQTDLREIEADELQLKQVIDNIVTNARHSMPGGGLLKVRAENMDIGGSELPLGSGKYVAISIEDHGVGIPEKLLKNIFDPFYATRQQSSGLGLASSYSIIKKHNGHITVESKIGLGTTFRIYLPVLQRMPVPAEDTSRTFPAGKGRILVMDDEEIVRLVVSKLLSQCGYDAELARDGTEMLKMYRAAFESGQPFDAVIMDLVIEGGMGGQEAIKYLLETDPRAKAIVSSGYSNAPVMSHFTEFGFAGFLAKPYRLEELGRVLHEVLEKQRQ